MNKIKTFIEMLRDRINQASPKKIVLFSLSVLLIITPTLLALMYAHAVDNAQADHYSVALSDRNGNQFASEEGMPEEADNNSLLGLFYNITTTMKQTPKAPGDPSTDDHIYADIVLNGESSRLKCYFSLTNNASYCIDGTGKIYSVDKTYAANFMASPFAEHFFSHAKAPKLSTIYNEEITPSKLEWSYKNYDGEFIPSQYNTTSSEIITYTMPGEIGIHFDIEPSFSSVRVYDGSSLIYDDTYLNLSTLTVDSGNELTFSIRATWSKNDGADAYGELSYSFKALITNKAGFSLNTDTVTPGSFAILSASNIHDVSKIIFESKSNYLDPVFHRDGEHVRAVLPIPESAKPDTLEFTITYGAFSQRFILNIVKNEAETKPSYHIPSLNFKDESVFSDDVRNNWNDLLLNLPSPDDSGIYFQGNFIDPETLGYTASYTHGSTIQWGTKADETFTALGTEYTTKSANGETVSALGSGKVISIGNCDLLGKYVVIDHGCGIRTWYAHLSTIDVAVGNILVKGDILGHSGYGGISSGNGFLIICTIYDTVIPPDNIIGKEIIF